MMDGGGVALVRRAAVIVVGVVVAVGVLGAPAYAQTPPNLTGSWIDPTAPPYVADWSLQSGANEEGLSADWHGTQAQGHPTLHGHFFGTLDQAGDAYSGRYKVTESGAPDSGGNLTVTINFPNQITVTFQPDSGGSQDIVFDRAATAAMPPASDWCASASATDASCESDPTTVAPGSDAMEASADFTSGQQSASVDVTSNDPTATNVVIATPPANTPKPLHAADCVKVAGTLVSESGGLRVDLNQADWEQIKSESGGPNSVLFAYALLACLEMVHAQNATPAAADTRVACPVSADKIKITHASHTSIKFTVKPGRVKPPLIVSCTRKNGKLVVHIRTRSKHKTLRQILGRKLLVGIYHSSKAPKIETASVAFAKH